MTDATNRGVAATIVHDCVRSQMPVDREKHVAPDGESPLEGVARCA